MLFSGCSVAMRLHSSGKREGWERHCLPPSVILGKHKTSSFFSPYVSQFLHDPPCLCLKGKHETFRECQVRCFAGFGREAFSYVIVTLKQILNYTEINKNIASNSQTKPLLRLFYATSEYRHDIILAINVTSISWSAVGSEIESSYPMRYVSPSFLLGTSLVQLYVGRAERLAWLSYS